MIFSFNTFEGETVDVASETIQLIDKGEKHCVHDSGMEARYHILVGDGGWCHRLSKDEYDRLHGIFQRHELVAPSTE